MELLSRKKYDLFTLENFLAENSDLIMIVCESPGSFTELGAFTSNEKTRVYEEKSVNKNFYDNSWLVSI